MPRTRHRLTQRACTGSVFCATSLDGFIAKADGGIAWLDPYNESLPNGGGFYEFIATCQAMVMGRNTFETVRDLPGAPWPYGDLPVVVITSGNNGEITVPERLVGKTEVVTVGEAGVAGVLDGLHAKYAATNVYIDGGIAIRSFIEAGLIGRAIITAVPETLGDGIALFSKEHLAMLKKEGEDLVFDNGCVQTTYVLR